MVNFLETEIEKYSAENDANKTGNLKKRLSALKASMVEYLVGGVTIAERDAKKDLIEDAIKNCRSAMHNGVGYAANYEGLRASLEMAKIYGEDIAAKDIKFDIAAAILKAYVSIEELLYGTVSTSPEEIDIVISRSLEYNNGPCNISSGFLEPSNEDSNVLCSIALDINIIDTLSKIITIMVTCNQCLLQAPNLNNY